LPNGADWLPHFLAAKATDASQDLAAEDFRRWLRCGEAMVLLDGLDEAPDRLQRKRVIGLIEAVTRAYADCPLVVTSRPAAYRDDMVIAGFAHMHIDALDTAAIDGFLTRWSHAMFR
jgi:predicted NACHT family NTPase